MDVLGQWFWRRWCRARRVALVVSVVLGWAAAQVPVHAIVDDAHSYAMEAALPYVEKGFKVRSDYWNGEVVPGEKKAVKHQLFKGNEYCFWLACDIAGAKLSIGVFDIEGNPVEIEVVDANRAKAVRILPPKTGSYIVVFAIDLPDPEDDGAGDGEAAPDPLDEDEFDIGGAHWALAYGYR